MVRPNPETQLMARGQYERHQSVLDLMTAPPKEAPAPALLVAVPNAQQAPRTRRERREDTRSHAARAEGRICFRYIERASTKQFAIEPPGGPAVVQGMPSLLLDTATINLGRRPFVRRTPHRISAG